MHDIGRGWMILGWIMMVLFWAGVVALIIWGVNRLTRHHISDENQTPLDIAKGRYARGEITREQFEEIKKNLQ
jgi:putative membrane protein